MGRPSKLSDDDRRVALQLHDAGESCRAIARRFDVSPTVISRLTRTANDTPGAVPEDEVESGAAVATPITVASAGRTHPELEFPIGVGGFAQSDAPAIKVMPSPEQERRERLARRAKQRRLEDERHDAERVERLRARDAELRAAVKNTKPGTSEHNEARRLLKRFLKSLPPAPLRSPSDTGVRIAGGELRDGPPPALWDNPYDQGPRGFDVVGS